MARAIQKHHITYASKGDVDRIVKVYKGEHGVLTKIQWWCPRPWSKGFIEALMQAIHDSEIDAVEL